MNTDPYLEKVRSNYPRAFVGWCRAHAAEPWRPALSADTPDDARAHLMALYPHCEHAVLERGRKPYSHAAG